MYIFYRVVNEPVVEKCRKEYSNISGIRQFKTNRNGVEKIRHQEPWNLTLFPEAQGCHLIFTKHG